MRGRTDTRFAGRKPRTDARMKSEDYVGVSETPKLPDEFNRDAPLFDEVAAAAARQKHVKKLIKYLAAAGVFTLGLALAPAAVTPVEAEPTPYATLAPSASAVVEANTPEPTAEDTPIPTATPTPSPTPSPEPTPTPTATPTPKPEVEGVELLYVEWVEGTGEQATFLIYARIPKKNIKEKRLQATELEVFAWLNGMRTVDDWDGINTLEVSAAEYGQDVSFGAGEDGDIMVTYKGTLYWADHPTPAWSDLVTIAVCGVYQETWELTDPSNSLTVGIGGKAFLEDTSNETPSSPTP